MVLREKDKLVRLPLKTIKCLEKLKVIPDEPYYRVINRILTAYDLNRITLYAKEEMAKSPYDKLRESKINANSFHTRKAKAKNPGGKGITSLEKNQFLQPFPSTRKKCFSQRLNARKSYTLKGKCSVGNQMGGYPSHSYLKKTGGKKHGL